MRVLLTVAMLALVANTLKLHPNAEEDVETTADPNAEEDVETTAGAELEGEAEAGYR